MTDSEIKETSLISKVQYVLIGLAFIALSATANSNLNQTLPVKGVITMVVSSVSYEPNDTKRETSDMHHVDPVIHGEKPSKGLLLKFDPLLGWVLEGTEKNLIRFKAGR